MNIKEWWKDPSIMADYMPPEWEEAIECWAQQISDDIDDEILKKIIRETEMEKIEGDVKISKQIYLNLLIAEMKLYRLEAGGVDNWNWYGESLNPDGEPDFDEMETEIIKYVKDMKGCPKELKECQNQ